MFQGDSPENFEQKCLCILVLDISTSMTGEPIKELNNGLQEFKNAVMEDFIASQRIELAIVTFGSTVQCIQEPTSIHNVNMPTLTVSGSTKLVDGVRFGMNLLENRKTWYRDTGQNYFRPWIVLITDGEPDPDQDVRGLSSELATAIQAKKFMFYSLGVTGYNQETLTQICSSPPPMALQGTKFREFFRWLSNSIALVTKSTEGEKLMLPPVNDWAQITV